MNLDKKVTIRLDLARFDALDDIARREGFTVSVSDLDCHFLERRLKVDRHG